MTPQTVNAYYNPVRNEIVFPAAILQPPFFDMAADDAVNYGGIGAVIGHEMGHGFDDQGRRYDAKGVLRDWWTAKDGEEFMRRAKGLVAQYLGDRGAARAEGQRRADAGREHRRPDRAGHRAPRLRAVARKGQAAPVLDGLTGDQRFFAGWAQAWRAKYPRRLPAPEVMADVHSPDMFRATRPLPNVAAFYPAFDVKPGDGLFLPPEQRVKIW